MNKSCENKLKDRLSNHPGVPRDGAKEAIFARLDSKRPAYPWMYYLLGGVLFVTSIFMIAGVVNIHSELLVAKEDDHQVENTIGQNTLYAEDYRSSKWSESIIADSFPPTISPVDDSIIATKQTRVGEKGLKNTEVRLINESVATHQYAISRDLNSKYGLLPVAMPAGNTLLAAYETEEEERVIPEKAKFLYPYLDAGAFFMYNRLKPNLDDGIYVGDFDSPFGMSMSRVGFGLHVGVQRQWNHLWSMRLGILYNNYNQSYSFSVRETTPDSVIVNAEYVEPVFHTDSVVINKRVSSVGLKFQSIWNLPSEYNSLFVSFEYHRRVSKGAEFTYQGHTYQLSSSNQYLVELGLRKRLFDLFKGDIYVEPSIRYAITDWQNQGIISVKPFSVGVSLNYTLK